MRLIVNALLLVVALAAAGYSLDYLEPSDDIGLVRPSEWLLDDNSGEYPIHLVHDQQPAELLIFRTNIADTGTVDSEGELRESVMSIIDDVILPLPKSQLISSTGFNHGKSAGFVLDFTSVDSATSTPIRHRLKSILFRYPDGHQVVFTLWGKSGAAVWNEVSGQILQMQESFEYTGLSADAVFADNNPALWRYVLPMFLVICLVFLLRIRRGRNDRPLFKSTSSFWRCSCGRLNPDHSDACHRCGTPHQGQTAAIS